MSGLSNSNQCGSDELKKVVIVNWVFSISSINSEMKKGCSRVF